MASVQLLISANFRGDEILDLPAGVVFELADLDLSGKVSILVPKSLLEPCRNLYISVGQCLVPVPFADSFSEGGLAT